MLAEFTPHCAPVGLPPPNKYRMLATQFAALTHDPNAQYFASFVPHGVPCATNLPSPVQHFDSCGFPARVHCAATPAPFFVSLQSAQCAQFFDLSKHSHSSPASICLLPHALATGDALHSPSEHAPTNPQPSSRGHGTPFSALTWLAATLFGSVKSQASVLPSRSVTLQYTLQLFSGTSPHMLPR